MLAYHSSEATTGPTFIGLDLNKMIIVHIVFNVIQEL